MNNPEDKQTLPVLDNETLQLLDNAIKPVELSAQRKEALFDRILDRIDQIPSQQPDLLLTIRQNQGNWIQIAPKVEKKQLYVDLDRGIENYLLRFQPGAEVPAHDHQEDEICLVLEGSVSFSDVHLNAGDHHVARKGSRHGHVISKTGALLYLQGALTEHAQI